MRPRADVDWTDSATSEERQRDVLIATQHSRLPVAEGSINDMLGVEQSAIGWLSFTSH